MDSGKQRQFGPWESGVIATTNLTKPSFPSEAGQSKRVYLKQSDFDAHGLTQGCPGCRAMREGIRAQGDSAICRARMEELLRGTAKGQQRLEEAERRTRDTAGERAAKRIKLQFADRPGKTALDELTFSMWRRSQVRQERLPTPGELRAGLRWETVSTPAQKLFQSPRSARTNHPSGAKAFWEVTPLTSHARTGGVMMHALLGNMFINSNPSTLANKAHVAPVTNSPSLNVSDRRDSGVAPPPQPFPRHWQQGCGWHGTQRCPFLIQQLC